MQLDSILQAALPPTIETHKPVGPTLMIGLGGTGKEILLRLRRKLVERYGSLSRVPFIKFMHLDTDTTAAAQEQYDVRGSDDPLHEEIRFTTTERINLTVQGGTAKYVQHINNYPHIRRWLPTWGKIAELGDLAHGAGQVRMASRLGFFDAENFTRITSRLEQCKRELRDAAIPQLTSSLGFQFSAEAMHVVLISSLAGGTGSGTFLDMGFLVKRYFPEADQIGIVLMPGFFSAYAGGQRVRANGYAALMELNHYTFGHTFLADWDSTARAERLPPPPFTNTYLIDGENEARLVIGSSGKEYDAYRMVAEALFHDYSIGEFAGMKRAVRVNLANFNMNVYTHNFLNDALRRGSGERHKNIVGDTYPTRFGSFGLTSIAFPTDRVQSACASRLAARVLEHWEKSAIDDPLERLFTTFLADEEVQFAQGRYERRDGGGVIERRDIETALMVFDAGGGKTFGTHLWQKAQTARNDLQASPNGQKASRLAEHRNELEKFLAREDSENPQEWGVGIRQLETNMRNYLARVKAGIEKKAAELADDPHYGVNYTLSMLRELRLLLRNENFWYVQEFDGQIGSWLESVQYYGNELDQLQMDVERHERERLFRFEDLKRDYRKLVPDDNTDEDLGAFYSYFIARVRKQVAKRGRQVCDEIARFLGPDTPGADGLLGRYYDLLLGFEKMKERLRDKEAYFTRDEKSELVLSLYREGDVDRWYRTWAGEPEDEETLLKTLGDQLLKSIFRVDSVTAALVHIQQTPPETVEAQIFERCRQSITEHPVQPDALAMLNDATRISVSQREELVRQAYRLSKVWLAPGDRGLEHTGLPPVRPDQRPCLIGVDVSSPARLHEFKALVAKVRSAGDTEPSFHNIGELHRGMIVFYNELAGVPAFYPSSITAPRGLRAAYESHADKDELHTDKNRFQFGDLLPKEAAEATRYADSLRAFVLARVLGLLTVRQLDNDTEFPTFRYGYRRQESIGVEHIDLGDESHAVDFLYREQERDHLTHRRMLLQMIEDTIRKLRAEALLPIYRLLLEFYLQKIWPPTNVTGALGVPDVTATRYSPEYAVLHEARAQLARSVTEWGEQKQFTNALLMISGKSPGDELTYEQFQSILAPYCVTAGRFAERSTETMAWEKLVWRDVFALDAAKLEKQPAGETVKPIERPLSSAVLPDKRFGERACPNCRTSIDRRAIYCTHCREMIAQPVACPHCEEPRVPSDLEFCWKCGHKMREEEQLDCPRCFSWRGRMDQFPCPHCSFDPTGSEDPGPGPVGTTVLSVADPTPPETAAAPTDERSAPSAATTVQEPLPVTLVQCPICYSMVAPEAQCSVCTAVLEAR